MLKINNVCVTVDGKEVVKGVSLEIKPGEIHALMGPNGSGKSSLAMALMGHPAYKLATPARLRMDEVQAGGRNSQLEMDGEDITNKTPDERARMGLFLASQYPVGVGGVTVEQLLRRPIQELFKGPALFRQGRALSDTRIDVLRFRKDLEKLAEKVGVNKELLRRSINVGFSGGEKKRLEILQMLMLQPKYAILDETDSGLDVDAMRIIARQVQLFSKSKVKNQKSKLQSKNENNPGILVITHYARLLHCLKPDFVHIMKNGKITESGGVEVATKIEKNGYQKATSG